MKTHAGSVCFVLSLLCLGHVAPLLADTPRAVNLRVTPTVRVLQDHRDAVVNVNTTQIVRQRFGFFDRDPFFRRFFDGRGFERNVKRTSLGSGFIIHDEGYIVTNAHVIDGADEVEVTLADGSALPARVLASDTRQDLAIIKVDPPDNVDLQPVRLGDSSDLMIGEPAIAIGNPLGYEHTVTSGIVSAVNRELPVTQDWTLKNLIQTDASINPGNSGGPLLNAYGQVIGVNTAIRGDAQNIGFAIPVNRLRELIPELLSPLTLNHVALGGRFIEKRRVHPPAELDVELWWQGDDEKSPSLRLKSINGRACENIVDVCVELMRVKVGQRVVISDGRDEMVTVAKTPPLPDGVRLARSMIGADVRELTDTERRAIGLRREGGVVITGVERNGPADQAGLQAGDVIVHVGYFRINTLKVLASVLSQVEAGTRAEVYVIRRGHLGRTRVVLRGSDHGSL